MAETIESLKKQLEASEKELALYKPNGSVGLYYELNRFINGTVDIMRKQNLENLLTLSKDEDPKKFERMMALIKNAKEHAEDMTVMKDKLGLSGNETKDKEKVPFIETVATKRD